MVLSGTFKHKQLWLCMLLLFTIMVITDRHVTESTTAISDAKTPVNLVEAQQRKEATSSVNITAPSCKIPKGKKQLVKEPVFLACFPGSGSELTLNLIESLTGVRTTHHGGRCDRPETPNDYIALKTHFPWHCRSPGEWTHGLLSRAVVLIRNAINALPSKANREYESSQKRTPHSSQAPEKYWIRWRDEHFEKQLLLWEELIYYWLDFFPDGNRLVVPYEHLVATSSGPLTTVELARFLQPEKASDIWRSETDCIWEHVVVGDQSERRSGIRRKQAYRPMFTFQQYIAIEEVLSRLAIKYASESFGEIFSEYARAVADLKSKTLSSARNDKH